MPGRYPDPTHHPLRRVRVVASAAYITHGRTDVKTRRLAIAGLAAVASLTLATAACGSSTPSTNSKSAAASSSPTVAADPKQVLASAVADLTKASFKIAGTTYQQTLAGSIDPVSKNADINVVSTDPQSPGKLSLRQIGTDSWIKVDLGPQVAAALKLPAGWMHVDRSKVKDQTQVAIDEADPASALAAVKHIVQATGSGGHYTGTADLSGDTHGAILEQVALTALAGKAKALPFEATVNAQGQLSLLKVSVPAAGDRPAYDVQYVYSNFGVKVAPQKPAGAVKAPAGLYQLINA
jgi:hypothetical protein